MNEAYRRQGGNVDRGSPRELPGAQHSSGASDERDRAPPGADGELEAKPFDADAKEDPAPAVSAPAPAAPAPVEDDGPPLEEPPEEDDDELPMKTFKFSISYLSVLFAALLVIEKHSKNRYFYKVAWWSKPHPTCQAITLCKAITPPKIIFEKRLSRIVIRRDRGFLASGAELLTQDEI